MILLTISFWDALSKASFILSKGNLNKQYLPVVIIFKFMLFYLIGALCKLPTFAAQKRIIIFNFIKNKTQ